MTSNVEKIVKLYKTLSQVPNLVSAKLNQNATVIHSVWSQRNIERGKTTKFIKSTIVTPDLFKINETLPIDVTSELLSATSPSEKYRAVLRDLDEKQYLEIWQNQNLTKTVDLTSLDVHGKVYTDAEFGTFQWSPDESKLIYIAEVKPEKSEPFYKRKPAKTAKKNGASDEPTTVGEEYLYRQDWGEQLVGKQRSIIAQYRLDEDSVELLEGVPSTICPAQVIYTPDGSKVVGIAYETEPRKLGLIYCSNRPSTIFSLDFSGKYETLNLANKSVKNPMFSPNGTLFWLQRNAGGPHAGAMALMKTTLPLNSANVETLVDIVKQSIELKDGRKFYGLFNSGFAKRCFPDDNTLVLSTNQQNTINTYLINVNNAEMTELVYDGSQQVLDAKNGYILVNRRNFFKQDILAIGKLDKGNQIKFVELTENAPIDSLKNCVYKYLELDQANQDKVKKFTAIYLSPENDVLKSTPLVVWPHGGPHGAFANNLALETSLFLSMGYACLLINYRGSLGAGQDSVDFLPGKVGVADVADCILATKTAVAKDKTLNQLVLVGGSHGGFLVTHLSGQYPDMFRAVVARNPVIDVAAMSVISDIPDWCYVEGAGKEYTQQNQINNDDLLAMRKSSPIEYAHRVKAPTLLQIGSKDLRVPPSQGIEFYHRLKANGVKVRLNLYEDNHPLGTVPNEMDNLINGILWIEKHLDNHKPRHF